jgi:hypothetical protein
MNFPYYIVNHIRITKKSLIHQSPPSDIVQWWYIHTFDFLYDKDGTNLFDD